MFLLPGHGTSVIYTVGIPSGTHRRSQESFQEKAPDRINEEKIYQMKVLRCLRQQDAFCKDLTTMHTHGLIWCSN
jgi:hypothetical protein